jgi:hypothetical protein
VGGIPVDGKPASTARTTPAAFESAALTEAHLAAQVADDNQEWEVRKIIGEEYF